MPQAMKLWDNAASPYAFKVRVTLYEKGIEAEKAELRYHSQRAELLRFNPRGEVPALVDGPTVLYDSRVICDYLEETHPAPALLPADPALRARCRLLETVADTQLDACLYVLVLMKLLRPELEEKVPQALARATAALERHWANLDRELDGKEYLVGTFSRADVAVTPHLGAAAFLGLPVPERHAGLHQWVARVNARPSIQRATEEALVAYRQSQSDPNPLFTSTRLHWRSDRVEWAVRVGLGPWLLDEIAADRAFFSPVP
jgi:glutathione S-transferase/RNA polymerase-associated protein